MYINCWQIIPKQDGKNGAVEQRGNKSTALQQANNRTKRKTKKHPSTKQFPKKSALFGFMGAKDQQYILNVNMALYIYTLPKKEQ